MAEEEEKEEESVGGRMIVAVFCEWGCGGLG